MTQLPDLIVSDIHLGAVPAETEAEFRRFLEHAATAARSLLINGDLFDFWFEYRSVIPDGTSGSSRRCGSWWTRGFPSPSWEGITTPGAGAFYATRSVSPCIQAPSRASWGDSGRWWCTATVWARGITPTG
jgi:hypothetical protein